MSEIFRERASGLPFTGVGRKGREGKGRKGMKGKERDGMGWDARRASPKIKFYDYSTGPQQ
jgi:hypothetical protein